MPPQKPLMDRIFALCVGHRSEIVMLHKVLYFVLLGVALYVIASAYYGHSSLPIAYAISLWSGKIAILAYVLTTLPGIARRFRFVHKSISLLMIFRRYIGITVYMFVFIHMGFMFLAPALRGFVLIPPPLFIFFGSLAHTILFFMFLTSNDLSVRRLDHWWNILHKLTYVALFFIFFHVALQRVSFWTLLMGSLAVVQIASFIASFKRTGKFFT